MTSFLLSYNPNTRREIMRPNKKYTKRTHLLGLVVMGMFSLTGCADFFQTLADGKNAVIDGATDVKDSAIDGLTDKKGIYGEIYYRRI